MSERQCSSSLQSFPYPLTLIRRERVQRGPGCRGAGLILSARPSFHHLFRVIVKQVMLVCTEWGWWWWQWSRWTLLTIFQPASIVRRWFSSGPVSLYLTERSDQVMHLIWGGTCHHVLWHKERANFRKEKGPYGNDEGSWHVWGLFAVLRPSPRSCSNSAPEATHCIMHADMAYHI